MTALLDAPTQKILKHVKPENRLAAIKAAKKSAQAGDATDVYEQKRDAAMTPQGGPQSDFINTTVDICFFGGAAGGGKTYALLMEPLEHLMTVENFGAVLFRRTSVQHTAEGGIWDTATQMYIPLDAEPKEYKLEYRFPPYGNRIKLASMEYEKNRFDWKSAQIPLILFDQLEDFTRKQFFYMLSRNRSTCGVRPYIRANYNPVPHDELPGGWIHEFVAWYIDADGYPIPERSGAVRWFVNVNDELLWYNNEQDAIEDYPNIPPTSFTYIMSTIYDNKILLEKDPQYLTRLKALGTIDEERLLKANHKIKPAAGKVFNRAWFGIVDAVPSGGKSVRFWDLAASEKKQKGHDPDFTAGMCLTQVGSVYYYTAMYAEQLGPADIDNAIVNVASQDGKETAVRWEEEGGASGKRDSSYLASLLVGYKCEGVRPQGDKLTRSKALAAQAKAGNIKLLRGEWNEQWLNHMHGQPDLAHDDIHDASAGAFNHFVNTKPTRGTWRRRRR